MGFGLVSMTNGTEFQYLSMNRQAKEDKAELSAMMLPSFNLRPFVTLKITGVCVFNGGCLSTAESNVQMKLQTGPREELHCFFRVSISET